MQLDRTLIAVRERGVLDILDMSLHVMRRHARPIAITFLMGAVPLAVLNYFLIGWMPDFEIPDESLWRYGWWMVVLIYLEAPLAGIFTTTYLGKAVFLQEPHMRDVIRDVGRSTVPLMWTLLLLRGPLPAWLLAATVDRYGEFNPGTEIVLILLLLLVVTAVRAFRPYIAEVVLLEKNPMTAKSPNAMTIGRRSARLHGPNSGEVFARWITCAIIGLLLSASLTWTMLWFPGVFTNDWTFGRYMMHFGLPCALWILCCYMTVVRFLNYLDLRIRQEGWEVELRVRAEANRMQQRTGEQATAPALSNRAKPSITSRLLAGILIGLAIAGTAAAQDDVDPVESAGDALASRSFPWYDRETGELRRLEVEPTNPNPNPSNPDWQARQAAARNPWSFAWLEPLLRVLVWVFWGVIVGLIALVIWLMVKAFLMSEAGVAVGGGTLDEEEDARRDAYRIEQLPFQLDKSNRADLLAEARRLYEAGDFRGAIIYLFSYQLLLLDRHHLIRLARGKTNRQYLRETRGFRQIARMLEQAMVPFEDVFFGDHDLERDRFESVWNRLPEFQQLLEKEAPAS